MSERGGLIGLARLTVAALEVSETELPLSSESEVSGEEGGELGGLSCRIAKDIWVLPVKGFSSFVCGVGALLPNPFPGDIELILR